MHAILSVDEPARPAPAGEKPMELVNGYQCRNCTDIDYAKRNIDPQHPKDGPFGINKTNGVERGPARLPASWPNFVTPYGAVNGIAIFPPTEPMTMIRPPALRISGRKAWVMKMVPRRLTSMCSRQTRRRP